MKRVEKKLLPEYYAAVKKRVKTFELRKDEDDIQVGDLLIFREWDGEKYTGHKLTRVVTYVLRNCPEYGLMEGYCIVGMMPHGWNDVYYTTADFKEPLVPVYQLCAWLSAQYEPPAWARHAHVDSLDGTIQGHYEDWVSAITRLIDCGLLMIEPKEG